MFYLLIRQGVKDAAVLNRIVTVAKVVPILVFVVLALFYLDPQVFADNWSGNQDDVGTLFDQVRGTMLVTVFVFLGVEGASVYSRHAERREDVGRATILGFLIVFSVFASVTIVSYGILPYAGDRRPAAAVDGRRAGGSGRRVGSGLRQHRPDRLGARRLPRLDADGRRGAVRRRQGRRHAAVPRAVERGRRAGAGAADDHRAGPGHARRHAVLGGRVQLRARPDQRADADPVPAGGGLRAEAGRDPRDVRRRAARLRARAGRVGRRHGLHRLPAVRRRPEVHPGLVHHLRAGDRPVRDGPARAGPAALLARRSWSSSSSRSSARSRASSPSPPGGSRSERRPQSSYQHWRKP